MQNLIDARANKNLERDARERLRLWGIGADEVKATFVSQGDLSGAEGALATELQTSLQAALAAQAGSAEKLVDTVNYTHTFAADHAANIRKAQANGVR